MCAINGVTTKDSTLVAKMNETTKHRGPDGSSIYVHEHITLGHNRLAIIDVSDASTQPMVSTDGRYVIVFNGEIYNYRELRDELQTSYNFRTTGDTEVLLAAYSVWGESMFAKLRGMYAFCIWDHERKELLLARDEMGIKPLYYSIEGTRLAFSSELPALFHANRDLRFDREAVDFYLSMEYVPGPRTLVAGIQKMRPGELLRFRDGVVTTKSFLSRPTLQKEVHRHDVDLYTTLDQAVHRQLVSDRPIGAYLSGGFDSSIVVHHMSAHCARVKTYSVDFEPVLGEEKDSDKFNSDARLAEQTAAFYGTEHTTVRITLSDVEKSIATASRKANEPIANSTAITQYLLSDFVRSDGTIVVLGGDGGDELFGGYTRHRAAMAAYMYQKLPQYIQALGASLHPRVAKLRTPFGPAFHKAVLIKDQKKIHPFLNVPREINTTTIKYFEELYAQEKWRGMHPLDVFMHIDRYTWLPDECFIRSDFASMAHGIELRVPFVDTDVVAYADTLSIWKKTLPHEGKRIIRETYKKHLPTHLYGQPKRGWLSPAAKWFRDPNIGAFAREVYSSGYYNGLDGLCNWGHIQKLLQDHVDKKAYYLYPLWNILVLQIWAREHKITW